MRNVENSAGNLSGETQRINSKQENISNQTCDTTPINQVMT